MAHKGVEHERKAIRFTEKEPIADSGSKTVPVLDTGKGWVCDSWNIANYLEAEYDGGPDLFGGTLGRAQTKFISDWADLAVARPIFLGCSFMIPDHLDPDCAKYFRESRAKRIGFDLDDLRPKAEENLEKLQTNLRPLAVTLGDQDYIGGAHPAFADYIVFSFLQWGRLVVGKTLVEAEPLCRWHERLMSLYGGLAGNAFRP